MKNSYTIFGQGFLGTNLRKYLKNKKYKIFIPKKGKFLFNKNLNNIIYCIGNDDWKNDPLASYEANLGIIPKIIFRNKFTSFTLISSTRVYINNSSKNTSEKNTVKIKSDDPNMLYNALKITAENLCLSIKNKKIKVIRMSNLFGDNFTNQKYILPTFVRESIRKKKINILINKNSSKDFLFVNEAIYVMMKIIKKSKHRIYNIAAGKNIKLNEIAKKIQKITNCKLIYKNQNKLILEPIINIERIKREFYFKPEVNLIKSLSSIIKNYKLNE